MSDLPEKEDPSLCRVAGNYTAQYWPQDACHRKDRAAETHDNPEELHWGDLSPTSAPIAMARPYKTPPPMP